MRPRIQALVDEFLDAALQTDGTIDLIRDLAAPLPTTVIAEIVGAPRSDTHLFKHWADDILGFQGSNRPPLAALERAQDALVDMRTYLYALIADRRRQPQDDLLSRLVAAESEGDRLSETELISSVLTLLVAGHETTLSLIGNGLLALLLHPRAAGAIAR